MDFNTVSGWASIAGLIISVLAWYNVRPPQPAALHQTRTPVPKIGTGRSKLLLFLLLSSWLLSAYLSFKDPHEKTANEITAAWKDYRPINVDRKKFINVTVPLDGFFYMDCEFRNVTLEYNGVTPIQLTHNIFIGPVNLHSKDPRIDLAFLLVKQILSDAEISRGVAPPPQ